MAEVKAKVGNRKYFLSKIFPLRWNDESALARRFLETYKFDSRR